MVYGALGERDRQTEVTSPLSCEIGGEFTLSLAKNSHFSFLLSQNVAIVALRLENEFVLSLAKNLHFSSSPLKWRWAHTFRCWKVRTFRKISTLHSASLKWRDKWSKNRTSHRMFGCTVFLTIEKWIKFIPKKNRKLRLCVRLRSGDKHHLRKFAIQSGERNALAVSTALPLVPALPDFVLCGLQIFSCVYPPSATSRRESRTIFFSISNSFWY